MPFCDWVSFVLHRKNEQGAIQVRQTHGVECSSTPTVPGILAAIELCRAGGATHCRPENRAVGDRLAHTLMGSLRGWRRVNAKTLHNALSKSRKDRDADKRPTVTRNHKGGGQCGRAAPNNSHPGDSSALAHDLARKGHAIPRIV